jgi:hypothetical protein
MGDPNIRILLYGKVGASTSLYFDGLKAEYANNISMFEPINLEHDLPVLLEADVVIVIREFLHMIRRGTLGALVAANIPVVWFADDDLMTLGREIPAFADYTQVSVQRFLRRCAAVIVTSSPLAETLGRLHPHVVVWPCVFSEALAIGPNNFGVGALRIGVIGGGFRKASLQADVLPATRAIAAKSPIEIYTSDDYSEITDLIQIPFEPIFDRFIKRWQTLNLHAVAHPYGDSRNIANKSQGSVLVSCYLGAVPVVGDEPAYAGLGEAQGVLRVKRGAESWQRAFQRLQDADEAEALFGNLNNWCRTNFAPVGALPAYATIQRLAAPRESQRFERRWRDVLTWRKHAASWWRRWWL